MTHGTTAGPDRQLAGRIATLMRIGTAIAAALLTAGAVVAVVRPGSAATILLTAGCALLVLLPVIRLAMMAGHFVRLADRPFVAITLAVIVLVMISGVVGIVL